ncbi:hypothetical protein AB0H42_04310 [Nocardia sp. NPDC050799]|uniref:hypothetical protein n=1 Tax=Nocardia sp. NPDC050799 TaxID=3154842 RepID=UPI003405ECD0
MADPNILTDAVQAYAASMTDAEFTAFTAAVREPRDDTKPAQPKAKPAQAGSTDYPANWK